MRIEKSDSGYDCIAIETKDVAPSGFFLINGEFCFTIYYNSGAHKVFLYMHEVIENGEFVLSTVKQIDNITYLGSNLKSIINHIPQKYFEHENLMRALKFQDVKQ